MSGWHRIRLGRYRLHWAWTDRARNQNHLTRTGFGIGSLLVSLWRYVGDDPRPGVTVYRPGWWGRASTMPVDES